MRPFGWKKWSILYKDFKKSRRPSIERYGLVYLHSGYALTQLAMSVAKSLGRSGKNCEVSIESIWIDGTPQAEALTLSGMEIKCELADLLFILEETDSKNMARREIGLLIQGKATPKYNKLTSGNSTKKERRLLEGMDRSQSITLYKGTKSNSKSIIGTYKLGGIPKGLSDCSRYLLMPKFGSWILPFFEGVAPFQVGWPKTQISPYIHPTKSVVEAIQQMALSGKIGKKIISPSMCEWSRLVCDLRGNYSGSQMDGYGGQPRVSQSTRIFSSVTNQFMQQVANAPLFSPIYPPAGHEDDSNADRDQSPSISIIKVKIRYLEGDNLIK